MIRMTAVFIMMIGVTGCSKPAQMDGQQDHRAQPDTGSQHYDRLIAGHVSEGDKAAEARAWLDVKNTTNALWKTTREQTLQWVNELYESGATKVYAVYAPRDQTIPMNLCAELLVVLPANAVDRKKVIKTFNRIDRQLWGEDADQVKDEGQKYLSLNMDP